jgi:RNA polymerase sigma factor (sigma-70 family)
MQFRRTKNDIILQPYLSAKDDEDSEKHLAVLLDQVARPRITSVIMSRLRGSFVRYERHTDIEDIYSEVITKVVAYLEEFKSNQDAQPCSDFRGYVAVIAHNTCNDYLRQLYPARTRLYKQIRDLLNAHPDFAIWKSKQESRSDWLCGFESWQGKPITSKNQEWIQGYYEDTDGFTDALASGLDVYKMDIDDLLAAIFNYVGGPVNVDDTVSIIADIKGIRDLPAISFEGDEDERTQTLSDSKLRIDSLLEMREPLRSFWEGLCQLPREEFKVYILYARDTSGEDLVTLFLAARIATEDQIAELLEFSIEQFRDFWLDRLPMDNESIARELGIKLERVYKLRHQAGKRMKNFLSASKAKI